MDGKIVCPICGGMLRYTRIDDGKTVLDITPDGSGVTSKHCSSNGSTLIECTVDSTHEIDEDTWMNVECHVGKFGY